MARVWCASTYLEPDLPQEGAHGAAVPRVRHRLKGREGALLRGEPHVLAKTKVTAHVRRVCRAGPEGSAIQDELACVSFRPSHQPKDQRRSVILAG